ncbi:MAG: hypothetical protein KDJ14_02565 [Xanthomonadales bacterium]|nr:hypothetical protein [Xanthomonadales bacterium]
MNLFATRTPAAMAAACLLFGSTVTSAAEQVRLSQASGLGSTQGFAYNASAAYNPDLDQVLVVWWGRDNQLNSEPGRNLVAGRLVDARSGAPRGPVVRLDVNAGGVSSYTPKAVYNPIEQEYLVVWTIETIATHSEIFVQRYAANTLQPLLPQPRQISAMGGIDDQNFSAFAPAVAFNQERNEYLVAWVGADSRVGMTDEQRDVFIQRLDGRDSGEVGIDDFRISSAASADASRGVYAPYGIDVAYSPLNHNYLVVWTADDAGAGLADNEFEIFGQLIHGATSVETGADDARLSTTGPNGNEFFDAEQPTVVAEDANFAVAYRADTVQGFKEILATKVGGTGGTTFGGQKRLTFTTAGDAQWPELAIDPATGEVLVAFQAREVVGSDPVFEKEVFVQRASTVLNPIGSSQRFSTLGPDGSTSFGPAEGVSIVPIGLDDGFFVAWSGDHDQGGQIDNEFEVFGRSSTPGPFFKDGFDDL